MKVKVLQSRCSPSDSMCFIEMGTKRIPAFFARDTKSPAPGQEVEVIISGVLLKKEPDGKYIFDETPKCFVRLITAEDTLVYLDGFETTGSMAQTMSRGKLLTGQVVHVTPGRLHSYLHNSDDYYTAGHAQPPALVPGVGWVRKNPQNGKWRLEGVSDLTMLNLMDLGDLAP